MQKVTTKKKKKTTKCIQTTTFIPVIFNIVNKFGCHADMLRLWGTTNCT